MNNVSMYFVEDIDTIAYWESNVVPRVGDKVEFENIKYAIIEVCWVNKEWVRIKVIRDNKA